MNPRCLLFPFISVVALSGACVAGPHYAQGQQAYTQQQDPGANYCPDRLPVAQERITQLYEQAYNQPAERRHTTVVRDPWGNEFRTVVTTQSQRPLRMQDAQTGLSDLVLNCGSSFSGHECFVTVFLDGEELADIGPTTEGRVAFQCLLAGRHNLRVTSPGGNVVYDGVIDLQSDHEHMVEIKEGTGFREYAANYIQGRVPAVPVNYSQVPTRTVTRDVQAGPVRTTTTTTTRRPVRRTVTTRTTQPERRTTTTRTTRRGHHKHRHEEHTVHALTRREFTSLVTSIKAQSFDKGRLSVMRASLQTSAFTSNQARQLVGMLSFKSNREDIAVEVYPRIVDPQNFHVVYRSFKFSSETETVNKRLGLGS